ncbi:unnamed protein product [Rhizophagus irregularis]|nr:unnamed protein product [Rhizophagus irregularis]
MSCSKILLGDFPELTYEIIKYFQNDYSNLHDYSTLHSCILVNRLWCRIAIPLLWENPFSIPNRNYNKMIEIYLYNLNDDVKTKLNEYKIINNSLSSRNIMFNYVKFLKYLNICRYMFYVEEWSVDATSTKHFEQNFMRLVHMSLFKIFIENGVNLRTLEIEIGTLDIHCYDYQNILKLILQNQNFIHNIGNLQLNIIDNIENMVTINYVLQIIHLHQNLKKIKISNDDESLYQPLLLSKNHNCSNTLNTIIFLYVEFKFINYLNEVFEQLNVLESVHIVKCSSLNNFIQQIINLTKPFKLKSLILYEVPQIETLQQLLQKSGNYLEIFGGYDICLNDDILPQLLKYCDNINFLYFYGYVKSEIFTYKVINLIENIKQSLNYLSMVICEEYPLTGSFILKNLGQILPSKLEYLSLVLNVKESDFRAFLENSQGVFVNKLSIELRRGNDDILHYIKEYIMKEKRVKYLAIKDNENNKELFDLKEEVREFELHNIKVQRHRDLFISDLDDFIWNID